MSQHWSFSQECSKFSSRCSVCKATRQLHLRDGFIHIPGERNNPYPSLNKLPFRVVNNTNKLYCNNQYQYQDVKVLQ